MKLNSKGQEYDAIKLILTAAAILIGTVIIIGLLASSKEGLSLAGFI